MEEVKEIKISKNQKAYNEIITAMSDLFNATGITKDMAYTVYFNGACNMAVVLDIPEDVFLRSCKEGLAHFKAQHSSKQ
jgi:hypothetical protein